MSAQLLSSKIVIQEEPPGLRTIQGGATGVVACLGIAQKGPVGVATLITSFDQFLKTFGGDIVAGFASHAVRGFFQGGGQRMYFTRVVHYSNITNPLTKQSAAGTFTLQSQAGIPTAGQITGTIVGPFALVSGDTLVIDRDGAGQATATFNGTPGQVIGGAGPFALTNNMTLSLRVDGGALQTVTFTTAQFVSIGAATEPEVQAVLNSVLTGASATATGGNLTIVSNTKGTGSSIAITGGTAAGPLGIAVSTATGTGNVVDLGHVSVAEIKAIVEAAVSGVTVTSVGGAVRISGGVTGPSGSLTVVAASTADDELGLDNLSHGGTTGVAAPTLRVDAKYDGAFSSGITIQIASATSGNSNEFNLAVYLNGVAVEIWPNLTMLDSAPRHVEKMLNADSGGSNYIRVTDLQLAPTSSGGAAERPASSPGTPPVAFGPLVGGNDGLSTLQEIDFIGDPVSRTGLYSFDLVKADLLICPDVATPAVQNAALSYCSVTRSDMFFIIDPPAGLSPDGMNTYVTDTAQLTNTTEFGAIYWPRIKVLNPSTALYGSSTTIIVPPSGHIAGMFARNDNSRQGGIYQAPGGVERGQLPGVLGLENDLVLDERVRDLITPNLINPITRLSGWPLAVDDVQTLQPGGNFPTIAERRGVIYIERALYEALQFCRLRNNDEDLRRAVKRTITAFLLQQMKVGAFRSREASTAFFVDVSDAINPPSEQFAGRLNVRIGLATAKPARWIIVTITQDTRALDEEIASAS